MIHRCNYVQLSIDVKKEIINLEESGHCHPQELTKRIPADKPRYHLLVFRHTHEGDAKASLGKQWNSSKPCRND